jgi:hypothetical protein
MQVLYRRGIHLPGPALWLDAHDAQNIAVVSHAHADHVQPHDHVISSVATAAMMRLRGVTRSRFRTVPFGSPVEWGDARLTLYPAGHILGSAQVLVEWEGTRLLYSGDFKLRPGRCAEPIEVPEADLVIMETTFGRPRYRLPDTEVVVAQIMQFCRDTLASGCSPVLLCYSLGKGQEVLACLEGAEFPIYLHTQHWEMSALIATWASASRRSRSSNPGRSWTASSSAPPAAARPSGSSGSRTSARPTSPAGRSTPASAGASAPTPPSHSPTTRTTTTSTNTCA